MEKPNYNPSIVALTEDVENHERGDARDAGCLSAASSRVAATRDDDFHIWSPRCFFYTEPFSFATFLFGSGKRKGGRGFGKRKVGKALAKEKGKEYHCAALSGLGGIWFFVYRGLTPTAVLCRPFRALVPVVDVPY